MFHVIMTAICALGTAAFFGLIWHEAGPIALFLLPGLIFYALMACVGWLVESEKASLEKQDFEDLFEGDATPPAEVPFEKNPWCYCPLCREVSQDLCNVHEEARYIHEDNCEGC